MSFGGQGCASQDALLASWMVFLERLQRCALLRDLPWAGLSGETGIQASRDGPANVPAKEPAVPCLQGPLAARWLDESDCVGAWEGAALAAAVFPTAESVPVLRMIDGAPPPLSALLFVIPS